jgi:hypothetical protein
MPFQRIEDILPLPWPSFDPECDSRRNDSLNNFETLDECKIEDERCAQALERIRPSLAPELRRQAQRLAEDLQHAVDHPRDAPATLACRIHARQVRRKLVGSLWPLVEHRAQSPVVFVNMVRTNMWVPADDLLSQDMILLKKRFINDFNHAGVTRARGWLMGTLDAEFDSVRGGYEFHTALIVSGEKVSALESLRSRRSYKRGRHEPHEQDMREFDRIEVQRNLDSLPDPLTYAAKMRVWNHRTYISKATGHRERSRWPTRIPEPHHSHWLLWMDRFSLSDLLITQGLIATANGFVCTNPLQK